MPKLFCRHEIGLPSAGEEFFFFGGGGGGGGTLVSQEHTYTNTDLNFLCITH